MSEIERKVPLFLTGSQSNIHVTEEILCFFIHLFSVLFLNFEILAALHLVEILV